MERGEAYISGELARVHSDIRSKLMQACRELKMGAALLRLRLEHNLSIG
jgi:hypothetical protein